MAATDSATASASDGADNVLVSGGGMILHWNGVEWTPADTGDAGLRDIEVTDDDSDGLTGGGGRTVSVVLG